MFPAVFVALGKWLRRKRQEIRQNPLVKSVHGLASGRRARRLPDIRECGPIEPGLAGCTRARVGPQRYQRRGCRFLNQASGSRSRRRKPRDPSRAGRNRQRSEPESRRRQGHDDSWDILLFRRSSEFIKIFRTSLLKQVMLGWAARNQVRDSTPSNAWAIKIPAPTRPITAVTISNIASILCAPHEPNDARARTVKRISRAFCTIGGDWGFGATGVSKPSRYGPIEWRKGNHWLTSARSSPFPPCSGCGIFRSWCGR